MKRAIMTTRFIYDRTKVTGHLGGKRIYHVEIWGETGETVAVLPDAPDIETAISWATGQGVGKPKIWLDGHPILADDDPVPTDDEDVEGDIFKDVVQPGEGLNEATLSILNEMIAMLRPGEMIHFSRTLHGQWVILTSSGTMNLGSGDTPQEAWDNEMQMMKGEE